MTAPDPGGYPFSKGFAVVHDYFSQRGGAERVALMLADAFSGRRVITALYRADTTFPAIAEFDVDELIPRWLGLLRRDHRLGVALYPVLFQLRRVDAQVTICSSSAFAHGVRGDGTKVVYCHTPARWLYRERDTYLAGWPRPVGFALRIVSPALRSWDRRRMRSADLVIANSTSTRLRIKEAYGLEAPVIPPPPGIGAGPETPVDNVEPGYFLSVSRLLTYKRVDVAVDAIRRRPEQRLLIVGDGPLRDRLSADAPPNCSFLGERSDEELRWLYRNACGLVSMAREDFGLTPVEAAQWGVPSITVRSGGFLDSVVDGVTGLFVDDPQADVLAATMDRFQGHRWDRHAIRDHARRFSAEQFLSQVDRAISDLETPPNSTRSSDP